MIESDEFYARPNETYERYIARKARNSRAFLLGRQTGKSQMTYEAKKEEVKKDDET